MNTWHLTGCTTPSTQSTPIRTHRGLQLRIPTLRSVWIYKCLCAHSAPTTVATTTTTTISSLNTFPSLSESLLVSFGSQLAPCLTGPTSKAVVAEAPTPEDAVEPAVVAEAVEEVAEEDAASSGGGTPSGEPSA
jgi:hypothetical protein